MNIYFVSDIHLSESNPALKTLFLEFIESLSGQAQSLYILGDLFDFWMGDDVLDSEYGQFYLPVVDALRALSDKGTQLFFIHGNRDFLLGQAFIKRVGGVLLPDQTIIQLNGEPTLLMHGDTLCTDDKGYQWLRRILHWQWFQTWYLSRSIEKRIETTRKVQIRSGKYKAMKPDEIMDVNQQQVEKVMQENNVTRLIHGHTHRAATHEFGLGSKQVKRVVLSDWGSEITYFHENCYCNG